MLFFNSTKKSVHTDFSEIGVDMHSHLLPGVDDGAIDIADSQAMISALQAMGFEKLITTPHTLEHIHHNTKASLQQGYSLYENRFHGIPVRLSSEYFLDNHFRQLLSDGSLLPLAGKRILIEFSQLIMPKTLEEDIFDLQINGYEVVLAHPERYLFFHKKFDYYKRLKEIGLEFQLNALSLTGDYGKTVKAVAERLIEKKMIDFIGTDLHHQKQLENLKRVPLSKHFGLLVESGMLKNKELNF